MYLKSKLSVSIVIALLGGVCQGAPLPDSPTPKASTRVETPFKRGGQESLWSRPMRIAGVTMVGLAAFDMGQTCHNLAHGGHEDMLPVRSCGGAVALTGAFDAAAIGSAWLLHRAHHDKLALIPMAFMSEQSALAIVYSRQHGAW